VGYGIGDVNLVEKTCKLSRKCQQKEKKEKRKVQYPASSKTKVQQAEKESTEEVLTKFIIFCITRDISGTPS
jgi:hypothetical protein